MLKRFEVKNYKNFKNSFVVDFTKIGGYHFNQACLTNGLLGKMIIYGRNATGKTNLGRAFLDICNNILKTHSKEHSSFLNVDSNENAAYFKYEFEFNNQKVIYEYRKKSENMLTAECLEVDNHLIFRINYENKEYDVSGLKYIQAETLVFNRYEQMLNEDSEQEETLPFIRWILSNTAFSSDSIVIQLFNFVKGMKFVTVGSNLMILHQITEEKFLDYLDEKDHLDELTDFFNRMGIKCKLAIMKAPDGTKNLYFENKVPIPFFENASSGTLSLYNLYKRIIVPTYSASFIYMDEFDAFYHYEMAENVVRYLMKKNPKCQMIMTTHNTNLMTNRLMRPDCLFILSQSSKLTALCNATTRELREGHNLEKMYISGEFDEYE